MKQNYRIGAYLEEAKLKISILKGYRMKITTDGAVTTVLKDDIQYGRDYYIMLRSDAHHDSVHCDRKLEKQHLD